MENLLPLAQALEMGILLIGISFGTLITVQILALIKKEYFDL